MVEPGEGHRQERVRTEKAWQPRVSYMRQAHAIMQSSVLMMALRSLFVSVFSIRAKLRWPLSLGSRCRDYMLCLCAFALACQLPTWRLARIEFAFAVARLGPPGFSPEVVRSLSTCSYSCIHEALLNYSTTPASKRKGDTYLEITTVVNISGN